MGGKREENFKVSVHNPGGSMRKEKVRKHLFSGEAGQDLLEFILVLPLLLIVLVGVLDLGRAFFASIAVANVAREGARFGVDVKWVDFCDPVCGTQDYIDSGVLDAAVNEATNTSLDTSLLDVSARCVEILPGCPLNECEKDCPLVVTTTYDFDLILDMILPDFTIQKTATMMIP